MRSFSLSPFLPFFLLSFFCTFNLQRLSGSGDPGEQVPHPKHGGVHRQLCAPAVLFQLWGEYVRLSLSPSTSFPSSLHFTLNQASFFTLKLTFSLFQNHILLPSRSLPHALPRVRARDVRRVREVGGDPVRAGVQLVVEEGGDAGCALECVFFISCLLQVLLLLPLLLLLVALSLVDERCWSTRRVILISSCFGTVFFGCCIAGALCTLLLPEVKGRDPDEVDREEMRVKAEQEAARKVHA